ncbi:MAG: thioredoxin domain-containing protein [Christensenellales bacterium]
MSNRLRYETSPYLLQHAKNPVDWYPWGEEAFEKARREGKPVFLSIGYSVCHWCHVMARESFENEDIAELLNRRFVCIKVDREERPDVDKVYMAACQAMTGGGGWPTSLFLTPEAEPFFAGTYFPPRGRGGAIGFYELLLLIAEKWRTDREALVGSAKKISSYLKTSRDVGTRSVGVDLPRKAFSEFRRSFDEKNGGFGRAPKFPEPHNLIFLLLYGKLKNEPCATRMATFTLSQMQKGGIYDHIGGGFSRYSTDDAFFAPHFEKMLYDNALLITAYSVAYSVTKDDHFLTVAKDCAEYVLREMTDKSGGFYSAQDADSEGKEGLYYLFGYDEITSVLGRNTGELFNDYYGVTKEGNFGGKNILNRLGGGETKDFSKEIQKLYDYRKRRAELRLDDKILTAQNGLMVVAMACLFRVCGERKYLDCAVSAVKYMESELYDNGRLFVGVRKGKRFGKGFFDDYAYFCLALICLYGATGERVYLERAKSLARTARELFADSDGGYYESGKENERLIFSAKETFDGALPSGNSAFYYVLAKLCAADDQGEWEELKEEQEKFMSTEACERPSAYGAFMASLLLASEPAVKIVAVCGEEDSDSVVRSLPLFADIAVLQKETEGYKLIDGKTTFYVCRGNVCLPPANDLSELTDPVIGGIG